jgi:23S rRNA (cytidine1920-2'-O)/16S rRNA (cytidine1409-2'-O)-methyltransferase
VRDAALRSEAVANVLWAAFDIGLGTAGILSSPIAGSHGNREYLVHVTATSGANPSEWIRRVDQLTGGAIA